MVGECHIPVRRTFWCGCKLKLFICVAPSPFVEKPMASAIHDGFILVPAAAITGFGNTGDGIRQLLRVRVHGRVHGKYTGAVANAKDYGLGITKTWGTQTE